MRPGTGGRHGTDIGPGLSVGRGTAVDLLTDKPSPLSGKLGALPVDLPGGLGRSKWRCGGLVGRKTRRPRFLRGDSKVGGHTSFLPATGALVAR